MFRTGSVYVLNVIGKECMHFLISVTRDQYHLERGPFFLRSTRVLIRVFSAQSTLFTFITYAYFFALEVAFDGLCLLRNIAPIRFSYILGLHYIYNFHIVHVCLQMLVYPIAYTFFAQIRHFIFFFLHFVMNFII